MNVFAQQNVAIDPLDDVAGALSQELSKGSEMLNVAQEWLAENGTAFAVNLVVSVLILVVGSFVIRLITKAVDRALVSNKHINSLMEKFLCNVVNKICWVLLLMVVAQRVGLDIGPLIAGLGVTGFILGFAFQESLSNLAAGMMIGINEPFKVGNYVIAGGVEGTVLDLNMMATTMATADNKKVVVPNKLVWGSAITNFSAMDKRRVEMGVGISYGANITEAKKVVLAAVKAVKGVLADVEPTVEVVAMGDSSVNLVVRPWCAPADYWGVFFAGNQAIKEALDAAGIEIPFPQRVVHQK
jgi:small conductance mechanosensitive channel